MHHQAGVKKSARGTALGIALLCAMIAAAAPGRAPPIRVEGATVAWVPGWVPHGAYCTLVNTGERTVYLVDVSSDDFARIELHGLPRSGLKLWHDMDLPRAIAPGEALTFEPGGRRLMLYAQSQWLEPGDTVTIRLHFRDFEPLPAAFTVRKVPPG